MDSPADSYIEVARFNEDDLLTILLDELRQFLRSKATPYLVDVDIPDMLSVPVTGYHSMQERKDTANRIMKEFETKFSSPPPAQIVAGNVTFTISNSSTGTCGPGLVNSAAIEVPSHLYISRIRYLVTSKAIKRESWTGDNLKKRYVIAIDTEQSYLDEEDVAQAVLGARVTDPIWPLPEVADAAKKGWVTYLEKEHLITKDRTYLASRGVFLSDPLCKNVSGVIVRKSSNVWFYPFSADEINDPTIAHLLD